MKIIKEVKILFADDDAPVYGLELSQYLGEIPGATLKLAETPSRLLELASRETFQLILLDICFNGSAETGLSLLPRLKELQPAAKIIMISSLDDERTLAKALELGATDFISKSGMSMRDVAGFLMASLRCDDLKDVDERLGVEIAKRQGTDFKSDLMKHIYRLVACAQRSPHDPVLIFGETGCGKDVIANAVALPGRPFISVDCGTVSESLAESLFFGHERGAFTGADAPRAGLFKLAHGGDLFLDEIGNLRVEVQEKLLRAIQTQEIKPIGGRPISVAVRLIAATNANLEGAAARGEFRQDLLERLKGICIDIPPLRERMEDFECIVRSILKQLKAEDSTLNPMCLALLKAYSWPGNVRELRGVISSMLRSSGSKILSIQNLPEELKVRLTQGLGQQLPFPDPKSSDASSIRGESCLKAAERVFRGHFIENAYKSLAPGATKSDLALALGISRFTLAAYLDEMGPRAFDLGLEVKRKG